MNARIAPRLVPYFEDYAAFHRTRGNELCHFLGITSIVLSLLGLLAPLTLGVQAQGSLDFLRLDGGTLLIALASGWYLFLDWRLGSPFALILMGMYFLGRAIPAPALWALFIGGWILQFVGHYAFEKNSPAFFRNLVHLLIGPLWVFARLTRQA